MGLSGKRASWGVLVATATIGALGSIAFASDVDVSVVDITAPTGSVTLHPGGPAGSITINMTVTGNQAGTATFDIYRDWVLSGSTFSGSNPQTLTVSPRAGGDPATTFSTTGTVSVASGQPLGTFTLKAAAFNITNSNSTGGKLAAGDPSQYVVTVAAPPDNTPPVIAPTVTGTLGNNGWYTSDVTVSWSVTDGQSAVTSSSGCGTSFVTTDTPAISFTCSATSAGGTNSQSVTIKRDATAPTIVGSRSPAANVNGWNNTNVDVAFTCGDALSGIVSCGPNVTVSSEGANQSVPGDAADAAGNSASTSVTGINIDKTAPTISASRSPGANTNGWNNTDVTVSFACSDTLSGLAASCPAPVTVSSEGAGQGVARTIADLAGNSASATESNINIDKTAPNITGSPAPAGNVDGWNNTDVTVSFTCNDALSDVETCSAPETLSSEGADQTSTGSATDKAGNTASTTVSNINIDKTEPIIIGSRTPAANANGWNNTDVTISFACSDAPGSGLASPCPADVVVSDEGAGQSVTRSATDKSGNTASETVSNINIDKTDPSISVSHTPDGDDDWNVSAPVSVTIIATDGGSGLGAAPTCTVDGDPATLSGSASPWTVSVSGEDTHVVSCSISDKAGNDSSDDDTVKIDTAAPTISVGHTPDGANGWDVHDPVTVTITASDVGSGLAGPPVCSLGTPAPVIGEDDTWTVSISGEGTRVVLCSVSDHAGNGAHDDDPVKIDTTAPTISGAATTAPNANDWYKDNVTVHYTCTDTGSGIDSCADDDTLTTEGADQSTSGSATDGAGNSATATVTGINIDKTAPMMSGAATTASNANGWYKDNVTVHYTCTDTGSGIDSCADNDTLTGEGVNQSTSGSATDRAGNTASTTVTGINIDKTAPTITASRDPEANANGWNNSDVTVSFSCSDALSGLAAPCPGDMVVSAEGAGQSRSGTATDKAGNSATATVTGINIDKTAPTVSLVGGPLEGASYYFGSVPVSPTCSASDALSGLYGSCLISGYSINVSEHTVTASVDDKAGNQGVDMHTYDVLGWTLKGFYQPVDTNGTLNTVKGGSTVPLKFEVFAATELTSTSAVKSFVALSISCSTLGALTEDAIEVTTTGGTTLRYDTVAGQFIQNWQTPKAPGSCYKVTMTTQDGSSISANFKLK